MIIMEQQLRKMGMDALTEDQLRLLYSTVGCTPESLLQDAAMLREWLEKQPHLPNLTEKEDEWLGRYVLACNNSMERAKKRLDYFFTVQAKWPEYFSPPSIEQAIAFGEYVWGGPIPRLLPDGTRLTFYKFAPPLAKEASNMNWMMFYMLSLGFLQLQLAIPTQPLVLEVVFDVENYSIGINNSFIAHLAEFRRFIRCIQVALPLHVRRVHIINAPALAVSALNKMIRPFLPEKLNQRVVTHESTDSLLKVIPHFCLPKDLGGTLDATMKELTFRWVAVAKEVEKWYEDRRWMKANLENKPDHLNAIFGVDGTFRKLTVD